MRRLGGDEIKIPRARGRALTILQGRAKTSVDASE